GVTGRGAPIGDPYDIDFVAHEIGHQFGATHTQNNSCNRTSQTAVEPGSASTLMGYAGICTPNVQGQSDDYFHAVSIEQIENILQTSANCATLTANGNNTPVANAGLDYSIPKSTPFVLKGEATDADGINTLTYNWEQIDNEIGIMPPESFNAVGPMFRSLLPVDTPERYFPKLETVISGSTSTTWEVIPSVARELNFSFLVRDNNATGGAYSRDDVAITVTDAEAFLVTSQNSNTSWNAGSSQTITWNKGTTDVAPINCANVTIKLSTDGGVTFPITLKENTPNDGSEAIVVPNNVTTEARIMVMASDNIFYNVNSTNFEILSTTPTFILTNESTNVSACNSGNQSSDFTINIDFINGFTETVTLSATGQPSGSVVSFNPNTLSDDGTVVMTVSNLDGITAQEYTINVLGTSSTISQNLDVFLNVTASNLTPVTLTTPTNGAVGVALTQDLIWQADANAISYDVEVASDINFNNIVASGSVTTNAYTLNNLSGDATYFWRVKSQNNCNESNFSSIFSFTTEVPSYCSSLFTDEAGGSEYIINVTFAGINNTSDNDVIDGYQDFTNINTDVFKNTDYNISVTFDTGGFQDHCYVFIDWNQDFIFDKDTERYDLGTKIEDVATVSRSISVPSDAKFGKTRMRVIIEYDDPTDGFGDGPCDADHLTEWGETEDYSITVTEPVIDPNNISVQTSSESCVDENDGIISVNVNQTAFNYNVTLTGANTNATRQLSGTTASFNDLPPGTYEVCIETVELTYTQCFEVEIVASNPISLKAAANKTSKKYEFSIDRGTAPYSVYLNDKLL
ncbi:GEVED domain-containing protein, partial [Polaribacter sp.]|uniref:GEVED domain-containing protein n=1 Tax=Polaribacter sp. TaxID=1920175 RepID=UPI003F6AC95B